MVTLGRRWLRGDHADLAGHGRSAAVTSTTTTQDLATDISALLDDLEVSAAAACGLSLVAWSLNSYW